MYGVLALGLLVLGSAQQAYGLTQSQLNVYDSGIYYFDTEDSISSGFDCSANLVGSQNVEKAYNFLVGAGLKPFQAAGVVGNMIVESGVEPQREQNIFDHTVPAESFPDPAGSSNDGWGVVQWTPGSKFINQISPITKANDLGVQLAFLWNQLQGKGPLPEGQAGSDVMSASTIEDAVLAFQGNQKVGGPYVGFERPKDEAGSVQERIKDARGVFIKYGSGSGSASLSAVDSCASGTTTGAGGSASNNCNGGGSYSAIVGSGSSFAGVDQGIDFVPSGSTGFSICAPASGTIVQADQTGHQFNRTTGQALIVEKLNNAPSVSNSSQYVYFAEIIQINSNIQVGTAVNKGDVIGTNNQSPGIEVGWVSGSGGPNSGFRPLCSLGGVTPCGQSFDSWIKAGGG